MTTTETLYNIITNHRSLVELLTEQGGEVTDELHEQILDAWVQEFQTDFANKIDACAFRLETLEMAVDALTVRETRLRAAKRAVERLSVDLKARMKGAMLAVDVTHVVGREHQVRLSNSAPSVIVHCDDQVPEKYKITKTTVEVSKTLLREDLLKGEEIPGAELRKGTTMKITPTNGLKIKEKK